MFYGIDDAAAILHIYRPDIYMYMFSAPIFMLHLRPIRPWDNVIVVEIATT